jgi:hypothetical protein
LKREQKNNYIDGDQCQCDDGPTPRRHIFMPDGNKHRAPLFDGGLGAKRI